jgi:DNA-binding GntR family transcriptional regulator
VEIGVVRLAIDLATDDDILAIKATWDNKYEEGLKGNYDQYIEHGKDFHLAIARATKNRVIEKMMYELLDATNQPLWIKMRREFHEEDPERTKKLLELHNDLAKALTARDSAKATLLLEEHFDMLLKEIYDLE